MCPRPSREQSAAAGLGDTTRCSCLELLGEAEGRPTPGRVSRDVGRRKPLERGRGMAPAVSVRKAVPWAWQGSPGPGRAASVGTSVEGPPASLRRGRDRTACRDLSNQRARVRVLGDSAAQSSHGGTLGTSLGRWRLAQLQVGSRDVAWQDTAQSAIILTVLQAV